MRLLPLLALVGCAAVVAVPADAPSPVPTVDAVPAPPPAFVEAPPPAFVEAPPAARRSPPDEALSALAVRSVADTVDTRAHVLTDKPLYRPGDTIWVKSWHLASATLGGTAHAGIRYELVGPRGEVVRTKFVAQRNGAATNDFELPTGAPGGAWVVRAATADGKRAERRVVVLGYEAPRLKKTLEFVRKAYVPGDIVAATVTVHGPTGAPLAREGIAALVRIDGRDLDEVETTTNTAGEAMVRFPLPAGMTLGDGLLTVLVGGAGATESISRRIPIVLSGVTVGVFPERGGLVANLPSRVYFAATKADGKPADVTGRVVDDRGHTVGALTSFHHGLGRFDLTPRPGRTYHLEIVGQAGETAIPAAAEEGCVLRSVDDFATTLPALRVQVRCTSAREVAVVGSLRGQVLDAARVKVPAAGLGGRAATVYLTPKDPVLARAAGVARVTLYDAAPLTPAVPIAERVVMRNRAEQLTLTVTPRAASYGPRDVVTVDLLATDPTGAPVAADVAVAVVDDTVLAYADDKQGDIVSRLLVEAELAGPVEEPRSFFAEPTGFALDLLLGTAGYRTFEPVPTAPPPVRAASVEPPEPGPWKDARVPQTPATVAVGALIGAGSTTVASAQRGGGFGGGGAGGGNFGSKPESSVVVPERAIVMGGMDRSPVDGVVKRSINQIRYCYQRELQKSPGLAGRVTVKFVIALDGSVESAVTKESTLGNEQVESCINGRFLRMQFPEPKGGIVIVTYPFRFSEGPPPPASARPTEPFFVRDPSPYQDAVRVFPPPRHVAGAPRTDFRDTVAWAPSVQTDASGRARVTFALSDAVTSFRVVAEGVGAGRVGRGEAVFASTLPFSLAVKLPVAAVRGDRLRIPLTLTNDRDDPVRVTVAPTLGAAARTVDLPARAGRTLFYEHVADTTIPVSFSATSDGLADAFTRTLDVLDAGYPRAWSASGRLDGTDTHAVDLGEPVEGSSRAWIKLYPNALTSMVDGLAGLLEMPHGCFEQASSSNYPNVLVLRYLEEHGVADAALAARSRAMLEEGYRRLTGYESPGGGFEWFGGAPGHEALTAYGIAQFVDMRAVFPVDETMLRRTTTWLASRADGRGGWEQPDLGLHGFGGASRDVADAYIAWSLVGAGLGGRLRTELDTQVRLAETTSDAYLLALATNTLLATRPTQGHAAAARLARLQEADGAFRQAADSITRSRGTNLVVETTALALSALLADGGYAPQADAAAGWLLGQRDGAGRWGSTQATVLTLEALTAYAAGLPTQRDGAAIVAVDGVEVGRVAWAARGAKPAELALPVVDGRHTVTVTRVGGEPVPYTIGAAWSTRTPAPHPGVTVAVEAALGTDRVAMGETVRLTAQLRNLAPAGQPMAVARIGIPAGLSVQTWQLDELRTTGVVDAYETGRDEVVVYFRTLAPGGVRTVPIDLLATVPGEFVAPASRAYIYYSDDKVAWAPPVRVAVAGG